MNANYFEPSLDSHLFILRDKKYKVFLFYYLTYPYRNYKNKIILQENIRFGESIKNYFNPMEGGTDSGEEAHCLSSFSFSKIGRNRDVIRFMTTSKLKFSSCFIFLKNRFHCTFRISSFIKDSVNSG